jgi:hypothetical protein
LAAGRNSVFRGEVVELGLDPADLAEERDRGPGLVVGPVADQLGVVKSPVDARTGQSPARSYGNLG